MRRAVLIAWLAAVACGAQAADDRSLLNHCKALVAQSQASAATETAEVQHCRQVIREWTLRDSRMSVDEEGRPLR
jgi:hypothetical protein